MPTPAVEDRFTVEIGWNHNIDAYVARVPDIPELAAWDQAVSQRQVRHCLGRFSRSTTRRIS